MEYQNGCPLYPTGDGKGKKVAVGGPNPPCRRKEAKYRREVACGLFDEENGHGYRQDFRGCGSDPAEGTDRKRSGIKLQPTEERIIPTGTSFYLIGKFEQVSNSGACPFTLTAKTPASGKTVIAKDRSE